MLNHNRLLMSFMLTAALLVGCSEDPATTLVFKIDTQRAIEMGLLAEGDAVSAEALDRMVEVIDRRLGAMEGSRASNTRSEENGQIAVDVLATMRHCVNASSRESSTLDFSKSVGLPTGSTMNDFVDWALRLQ